MVKGLETLELRVRQHCVNAAVDRRLPRRHIRRSAALLYPGRADFPQYALAQRQMPGGGSLVTFDLAGDKARVFRFLNALNLIDISNNLGDAKSLITHPATTTHQRLTPDGPRPARHHRQHGPPLRRPRRPGRPHRGPGSGAGGVRRVAFGALTFIAHL